MAFTTIAKVVVKAQPKASEQPTMVEYKPDWSPKNAKNGEVFPTISVGVKTSFKKGNKDSEGFAGLSAGIPKWKRVFGLDKDGDSVLAGLFQILHANHCDEKEQEELVATLEHTVSQINEYLNFIAQNGQTAQVVAVETEEVEEVEEVAPVAPAPVAQPAPQPKAKDSTETTPFALPVPKSEKHIGGSLKHYRENVHAALAPFAVTLTQLPADAADGVRKMVEQKVRTAWAAAKYTAHPVMFA